MKEQLVSFETAKLASEKGFNYMKANIYGDNAHYHRDAPEEPASAVNSNVVRGTYLAPTQSLLQKWMVLILFLFLGIYTFLIKLISQLLKRL